VLASFRTGDPSRYWLTTASSLPAAGEVLRRRFADSSIRRPPAGTKTGATIVQTTAVIVARRF
jgi:hypothetical protein